MDNTFDSKGYEGPQIHALIITEQPTGEISFPGKPLFYDIKLCEGIKDDKKELICWGRKNLHPAAYPIDPPISKRGGIHLNRLQSIFEYLQIET